MSEARSRQKSAAGVVLLETIVALTVLAIVGSAAAWSASEWIRAVIRVHDEEVRVRAASHMVTAISLWPREDLDRHLGWRAEGALRMWVGRPRRTLYEVSVSDSTGGILITTLLFRNETTP